jgi:hypothetical protein
MTIIVKWADGNLRAFGKKIERLQVEFPQVLPRVVNQVGNRAKTQVIRNLTAQTGLPRATIVKAVGNPNTARPGKLSYQMVTRGGNIRLKYLKPRETRPGVTAAPWGQRQLYPGTFMLGGKFPNRHGGKFGGHVMRRLNASGTKLTQARSGMFIPTEMTRGATAAAFERIAAPLLQERVGKVIAKLIR